MKKKHIIIIAVIIVMVCAISIFCYFHVAGRQIDNIKSISDACTVMIIKYQHMEYDKRNEYVLDAGQIDQLKELIIESSFTRELSNMITLNNRDIYDIQIDFNNYEDFISIHCIGNEYITVTNQFNGMFLKINNRNWKATLEKIIQSADAN